MTLNGLAFDGLPVGPALVSGAGAVLFLLGAWIMYRAHRSKTSEIDWAHLLVDPSLDPPRVTLGKFTGLGAFLASTWWVTWLVSDGKADAALLIGYMGVWGAVKVASEAVKEGR
jgi:hypothetical protein